MVLGARRPPLTPGRPEATAAGFGWLGAPAAEVACVARSLLGWQVSANGVTVRLTEVEAYGGVGEDPASHAYRGRTGRNAVMFGPAGYAYVYFVFGMHWCLNVVVGTAGEAAAVLLRAGEVTVGADLARDRRGGASSHRDLARGPARLATALGLDGSADGTSLVDDSGPVSLDEPLMVLDPSQTLSGPRVGVAGGASTPWRFWVAGDLTVSPYRRHTPRQRGKPVVGAPG